MNNIQPELFVEITDKAKAIELFKACVQEVQVEVFSYCNRRCPYCPVAEAGRNGANRYLDIALFNKILTDLSTIAYDRRIGLNLYNEPLADPIILERIKAIRDRLPRAQIYFYSNGDYLNAKLLKELEKAGLNELFISIHLAPTKPYTDEEVKKNLAKLESRSGLKLSISEFVPGYYLRSKANFGKLSIEAFALNYITDGQDRGGLMANIKNANERLSPCDRPFHNFVVSYDGSVVPCCQIFIDHPQHAEHKIGHLDVFPDIFRAYTSEALAAWRLDNIGYGPKEHEPCAHCSDGDFEMSPQEKEKLKKLKDLIVLALS